ncbi:Thiamine pyrophosphate (TPP)-dependent enzyme [Penicillium italicum]|uniref:Thiamine pyrophosphate (TPP)-dependent enzyme n=1 Tax=Penicillium italicum TaxID=40296 RepID=A0A0A2L0N8_PENIT|nr:Thiamine pyrophosphate (TPP)-dependent enzyme [Penicillium italicum]
MSNVPADITLAGYLFKRLYQVGLHAVHGVPGKHNIAILREATDAGLEWVAHSSDLSAGLVTDGYARVKGIAALVSSFGNVSSSVSLAIAASYQDKIPVVLLMGTPERKAQAQASKFHHSFFDAQPDLPRQPDGFQILADWFNKITITQEFLVDPGEATAQIDTAIRGCIMQSMPVYIELPEDLVTSMVPAKGLIQRLDFNTPPHDVEMEKTVVASIMNKIRHAQRPLILVDAGVSSCGLVKEANQLAKKTRFPTASTQFSRGVVDETLKNFHGDISDFDMYGSYFRSSDLIFLVGPLNTIEWTVPTVFEAKIAQTVTFNRNSVLIGDQKYELFSRPVLQQILKNLSERKLRDLVPYPDLPNVCDSVEMLPTQKKNALLQHDIHSTFWRRMSLFFRPGDIILTETEGGQDGARSFVLPRDTTLINPGARKLPEYMLATTMGVAIAQQGLAKTNYLLSHGRTILFEGAEGFQWAQNDFRAILEMKLNIIILVINDGAPIVESLMHRMEYQQQDSGHWRYSESVSFFGTPKETPYPVFTTIARTWGDFDTIIHDERIQSGTGLYVVELMIKPGDPTQSPYLLAEVYGPPPSPFSLKKHHFKQG